MRSTALATKNLFVLVRLISAYKLREGDIILSITNDNYSEIREEKVIPFTEDELRELANSDYANLSLSYLFKDNKGRIMQCDLRWFKDLKLDETRDYNNAPTVIFTQGEEVLSKKEEAYLERIKTLNKLLKLSIDTMEQVPPEVIVYLSSYPEKSFLSSIVCEISKLKNDLDATPIYEKNQEGEKQWQKE